MYNPYNTYNQYNPYQGIQNNQIYRPVISQTGFIKGRAVTSFDEANAAMIDLDGSLHVFPDVVNGKIYTKQINLDGTATLNTYILSNNQNNQNNQNNVVDVVAQSPFDFDTFANDLKHDFVAKQDFENVIFAFSQRIDDLQKQLEEKERAQIKPKREKLILKDGEK